MYFEKGKIITDKIIRKKEEHLECAKELAKKIWRTIDASS
jgi:hypothetical protein